MDHGTPSASGPGVVASSNTASRAKPHSGLNIVIHTTDLDRDVQAIQQVLRTDPCRILGHRAAYLAAGGIACGVCGVPL